jgi:hypothetical protein
VGQNGPGFLALEKVLTKEGPVLLGAPVQNRAPKRKAAKRGSGKGGVAAGRKKR